MSIGFTSDRICRKNSVKIVSGHKITETLKVTHSVCYFNVPLNSNFKYILHYYRDLEKKESEKNESECKERQKWEIYIEKLIYDKFVENGKRDQYFMLCPNNKQPFQPLNDKQLKLVMSMLSKAKDNLKNILIPGKSESKLTELIRKCVLEKQS